MSCYCHRWCSASLRCAVPCSALLDLAVSLLRRSAAAVVTKFQRLIPLQGTWSTHEEIRLAEIFTHREHTTTEPKLSRNLPTSAPTDRIEISTYRRASCSFSFAVENGMSQFVGSRDDDIYLRNYDCSEPDGYWLRRFPKRSKSFSSNTVWTLSSISNSLVRADDPDW